MDTKTQQKKIRWKNDLATGIADIDRQHKEFFRLVNKLLDNTTNYEDGVYIKEAFYFLKFYVCEHFGVEEAFMMEYKYVDYALHKGRHLYFRGEMERLNEALASGTLTPHEVAMKLNYLTTNWFVNHIKTVDKVFCRMLLEKSEKEKGVFTRLGELAKSFFKKEAGKKTAPKDLRK